MRLPIVLTLSLCLWGAALPVSAQDGLPEGEGKALVLRMCVGCHGLETVTEARFSKGLWASTVDEMISKGAKGTPQEIDTVIGYLARNFAGSATAKIAAASKPRAELTFPVRLRREQPHRREARQADRPLNPTRPRPNGAPTGTIWAVTASRP